jgi:hypothetical protein
VERVGLTLEEAKANVDSSSLLYTQTSLTISLDSMDESQEDQPKYAPLEDISGMDLFYALEQLHLINDDMYLRSQAHNLAITDQFLTELEYKVLREWFETDRTPPETMFLSAQSQMWILPHTSFCGLGLSEQKR